jgi:hypothetical protein
VSRFLAEAPAVAWRLEVLGVVRGPPLYLRTAWVYRPSLVRLTVVGTSRVCAGKRIYR